MHLYTHTIPFCEERCTKRIDEKCRGKKQRAHTHTHTTHTPERERERVTGEEKSFTIKKCNQQ